MSNVKDLRGMKFNALRVIKLDKVVKYKAFWNCICSCGNEIVRSSSYLKECAESASCGCKSIQGNTTHGESKTALYKAWTYMKNRCRPNGDYGKRGITVCQAWRDFPTFKRDMGPTFKEGLSLDRKDNLLGYDKQNCRWVTKEEQQSHSSKTIHITHNGKSITLKEAGAITGVKVDTLRARFKSGWSVQDIMNRRPVDLSALTQPLYP